MDIFIPIVICFILFVFFTLCGMCCKRRRDAGAVIATPVVITSTQHHVGPYPVSQTAAPVAGPPLTATHAGVVLQQHGTGTGMYPMPQPQQPMPGYNPGGYPPQQHQAPYPAAQQFPQHQQMPMPMPMPGTAPPMATQATMNPPSYDQVVTEGYSRQAPFNPNYSGGQ